MSRQQPRILLIGPLRTDRQIGSIGGTTVSFGVLLAFLRQHDVPHRVINTQKYAGGWRVPLSLAYTLWKIAALAPRYDLVMVNVAQTGALYAGPLLYLAARLLRRPFVFRMFGGDLVELYERCGRLHRLILRRTVLQADLALFQTQRLVKYFRPLCRRIGWLPTSRTRPTIELRQRTFSRRFIFLSQVKRTKGIDQVLAAREQIGTDYVVDIVGPILEPEYEYLRGKPYYKGVLQPEDVVSTLARYDVLLLPSFHQGEGYPGIILEANSVGVPVIATRWLALPEIVDHEQSGLLIAPHSEAELVAAMRSISTDNFAGYSKRALAKFAQFDSELVNQHLLEQLISVVRHQGPAD